ncbi:hypothetical protein IFR05_016118 [Cadophora sp. M221]|nr:hypothetical protein IFR05_016118 [Cadophora sp. M221]
MQGTAAAPVKKAPRSSLLRSCERCRRRKIRCDDYFPCAACTRLGLQCKLSDDRRAERSQRRVHTVHVLRQEAAMARMLTARSFLEERVKRLESLLAQQENRDGALSCSRPATPNSSITPRPLQLLRLQIPPSPTALTAPEDASPSSGQDFQVHQMAYTPSYCSSPVDFTSSPVSELPPWSSSEVSNVPDQASFFELRRASSFPFTPGTNYPQVDVDTNFPTADQDNNCLVVPDIPTIEVTSWETQSHFSNDGGMNDIAFNLPDLSVGSWSGPPSPSLTALSHGFGTGNDEYLSEFDLDWRSRRSSVAYSERSFHGIESLKPAAPPKPPIFTQSPRPRSRSDVLPQPTRYLDGTLDFSSAEAEYPQHFARSDPASGQIIPGADEAWYSRTFLERVHPYFPILSSQDFISDATFDEIASQQHKKLKKFKMLLVLAIGSQFQHSLGGCSSSVPDLYFRMAQDIYPIYAWQQDPSLEAIQAHLLLALYTLLSTYSSSPTASTKDTRPNIWMLNALTTASAIDLNLHSRADLQDAEQNTFISVYVLDKVVGILLGKPNLLRGLNIDVGGMRRIQGIEESNRMTMDELTSGNFGSGWRSVLEWYRTEGHDFVL